MKTKNFRLRTLSQFGLSSLLPIAAFILSGGAPAAGIQQETFASPQQAVEAFVAADRKGDTGELLKLLGSDGAKLVQSGDPIADQTARRWFASAYDLAHKFQNDGAAKTVLVVGMEEWPLPIPLVKEDARWRFDTKQGEQEILNRRVGRNELNVIDLCRTYVEAQREYAAKTSAGRKPAEYAQTIISTKGKRDGLYWPATKASDESPIGPLVASAQGEGYNVAPGALRPYHGYYYRILTRQGKSASGGAINYIVNGQMVRGFALVAFPASYGDSGVMTFIINQDGIVFEKNLGPDTDKIAGRMTEYDPDKTWSAP